MTPNLGHYLVTACLQDKKDLLNPSTTIRFLSTPEDAWNISYLLRSTHTATLRNLRGEVLDIDHGLPELQSRVYL